MWIDVIETNKFSDHSNLLHCKISELITVSCTNFNTWIYLLKCRMFNACTTYMYDAACTMFHVLYLIQIFNIVSHSYFNKVTSSGFNEVISTIKIHVDLFKGH